MNTLLQTAVSTWEAHSKNNVASALIVDGLVTMHRGRNNTDSPETYEMTPVENKLDTAKTDAALSMFIECLSGPLKASA